MLPLWKPLWAPRRKMWWCPPSRTRKYADKSTLPEYIEGNDICNPSSTTSEKGKFRIDMKSIDNVLYGDYNSMYEIKFPNSDIKVKCKLR